MSHHSDEPFSEAHRAMFEKLKSTTADFKGALGDFPEGKIRKEDEGEIQFGVGHENGKVILNFGTPVAWLGMKPTDAVALAQSLLDHARQCSTDVLTIEIGGRS